MIPMLYEPFQYWADGGSIYILSDTHFGDADCKCMDENWITPHQQVEILNKSVRANDTLILLGDVGDLSYVPLLNGYKVLIKGNHDDLAKENYAVFDEVYDGPLFIAEKILLSHEPIKGLDFCINIHGHDHGHKDCVDDYHLNLAANVCGYKPISLGKAIKNGLVSKIQSIHRETINRATKRKNN